MHNVTFDILTIRPTLAKIKHIIMTIKQATRLYYKAEIELEKANGRRTFIDRAMDINEYIERLYGEEMADEILDLVFENEIN